MARTMTDEVLGALTWDAELGTWLGRVRVGAVEVDLEVVPEDVKAPESIGEALPRARALLGELPARDAALRAFTGEDLAAHADTWTGDLSARQLAERLTLTAVSVYPDGEAELWYTGDALFDGHELVLPLDADGTPGEPDVVG